MRPDYTLCLVTGPSSLPARTLPAAVERAILGGCTMVQLREKGLSDRAFYREALALRDVTARHHVPLIVNDRADIALSAGADGVHVGQRDLPPAAVRRILGPERLLGVSVTSVREAERAEAAGADYLGVGAMFSTETKADARRVSLKELMRIRRASALPILVIGGIGRENAGLFRPMGADGLAAVSAILNEPDIRAAAAGLREAFLGEQELV